MNKTQEMFLLLRSVIDYKIPEFKGRFVTNYDVDKRISDLTEDISVLLQYIELNRYDSNDVKETRAEIEDIQKQISNLNEAKAFYITYNAVVRGWDIDILRERYNVLSKQLAVLQRNVNLSEKNTLFSKYDVQVTKSMNVYKNKCKNISAQMAKIMKQIKALEK